MFLITGLGWRISSSGIAKLHTEKTNKQTNDPETEVLVAQAQNLSLKSQ